MLETVMYVIAGVIVGGIIGWFLARSRTQQRYARQIGDLHDVWVAQMAQREGKIKYAEAQVEELRDQVREKGEELIRLRGDLAREQRSSIEALTNLRASEKSLEEQRLLVESMKKEMTDTFNALSAAALKSSSEDFLRLASEHLGKIIEATKGKLGEHQAAMDGMIKPLYEALERYETQIKTMENDRLKTFGGLEEQLRTLSAVHESLHKETSNLVTALRKPQVRGRWGEMQLKRVVEISGMSAHCDFTEQVSVDTDRGRIRPDMIVHLPMERDIVVDSKVPLEAYLDALSASTEDERKTRMERHSQQVRAHMNGLASKEYWNQFGGSPEFAVLFIPGESFLSAALDVDPALLEDGIQKRVIIATPTTFVALLKAIAYGWQQEQITKNARQISALGKELYERVNAMVKHFHDVGAAIRKTTEAYNSTVGSMESRVLPSVRRFKELGVTGSEEIPILQPIDQLPRSPEGALPENRNEP
jgi:DNA recombination protein RmuC